MISSETREVLKHFTNIDTWHTGHPNDADRFYDFIVTAYRNGDFEVSVEEFEDSFPNINAHLQEYVDKLYIEYETGIAILRKYNGN